MCQTANDMLSEAELRDLENEYCCVDGPVTQLGNHEIFTTI